MMPRIRQRLDNIAEVRPEIGKSFNIWNQPHLRRVTLDQMGATPLQREVVDPKARSVAVEGGDKTLLRFLRSDPGCCRRSRPGAWG